MQVVRELAVLPRELSPELRKRTSELFKAAKSGAWEETESGVRLLVEPAIELAEGQYTLTTQVQADEGTVASALPSGSYIALDTEVDAELEAEGFARDLVRQIQDERKNAGLHVADRIALTLRVPAERLEAVQAHLDFIKRETLALEASVEATDVDKPEVSVAKL